MREGNFQTHPLQDMPGEKLINTTYSDCRYCIARKVPLTIFSKLQARMELQKYYEKVSVVEKSNRDCYSNT